MDLYGYGYGWMGMDGWIWMSAHGRAAADGVLPRQALLYLEHLHDPPDDLLDELFQKGYVLGSGMSFFSSEPRRSTMVIAATPSRPLLNLCVIFWSALACTKARERTSNNLSKNMSKFILEFIFFIPKKSTRSLWETKRPKSATAVN